MSPCVYLYISVDNAIDTCADLGIDFSFHVADTRKIEIEETDLLFIDTEHNYEQIQKELELHGNKARKFILVYLRLSLLLFAC